MTLYLHPTTSVIDAAIHAFEHGSRLSTKNLRVTVVRGRDHEQYEKAKKAKALREFARGLKGA